MRRTAALLAAALLAGAAAAGSGRAGTEEFSTFDVVAQEGDDESLLDHLLTRAPVEWREEWERAPQALRSAQGCLTSGQWFLDNRLRVRAPLGGRAAFGLDLRQEESDRVAYQYLDFSFRAPTRWGTPGFSFRPLFDKSRQDAALFWEAGAETSAAVARATLGLEDVFNNLWAFRQTRVGDVSEPYERHPFEPALWARARRPRWGAELLGQWLTPSRKRLAPDPVTGDVPRATLWGALGRGAFEVRTPWIELELAGEARQALARRTLPFSLEWGGDHRRQWTAEAAVRRGLAPALAAEARWVYVARDQRSDPPFAARAIDVVERALQLELRWSRGPWSARAGGLYDRVTVGARGAPLFTHGTRTESRAYLGLGARLGAVRLQVVEGFELDPEPYDVWGVHDKAFFQAQTSF